MVGEFVSGRMSEHVWMNLERKLSGSTGTLHHAEEPSWRYRSASFRDAFYLSYVGKERLWIFIDSLLLLFMGACLLLPPLSGFVLLALWTPHLNRTSLLCTNSSVCVGIV